MRKLKRVTIKEEFVALTGDPIKAIILNQFIYWSERVGDFDSFIAEEKTRAEQSGLAVKIDLLNGWIYKTAEELSEETMVKMSPSTILRHIKQLVERGWLDERNNPNHKWDRTKQYRVNLLKIHEDLIKIGYVLQDYKVDVPFFKMKNAFSKMKNGTSNLKNGSFKIKNRTIQNEKAIPEITTDNTIIHSSIHHSEEDHVRAKVMGKSVNAVDIVTINAGDNKSAETAIKSILVNAGFDGLPVEVEYMSKWVDVFPSEMIKYAVNKTVLNGIKSLPYVSGIFEDWLKKGIKTIEQAEKETRYDSILFKITERGNTRGREREIGLPDPQLFRDYQNQRGGG